MTATIALADDVVIPRRSLVARSADAVRRNPTIFIGAILLAALVLVALLAPVIAADPFRQAPINRMRPPSERWWFGTDQFGRDIFSRTIYGTRV
ncbi:MAG TPA: ABC transporter permease, partial [Beijerinckiaceae bacterium]|nr:ABC transporter permease [Beijerinckiaceae bacterium]